MSMNTKTCPILVPVDYRALAAENKTPEMAKVFEKVAQEQAQRMETGSSSEGKITEEGQ